jgi:hypothetical protein
MKHLPVPAAAMLSFSSLILLCARLWGRSFSSVWIMEFDNPRQFDHTPSPDVARPHRPQFDVFSQRLSRPNHPPHPLAQNQLLFILRRKPVFLRRPVGNRIDCRSPPTLPPALSVLHPHCQRLRPREDLDLTAIPILLPIPNVHCCQHKHIAISFRLASPPPSTRSTSLAAQPRRCSKGGRHGTS